MVWGRCIGVYRKKERKKKQTGKFHVYTAVTKPYFCVWKCLSQPEKLFLSFLCRLGSNSQGVDCNGGWGDPAKSSLWRTKPRHTCFAGWPFVGGHPAQTMEWWLCWHQLFWLWWGQCACHSQVSVCVCVCFNVLVRYFRWKTLNICSFCV